MRLALLLHEAKALGLPPPPQSFTSLKKLQLKWETEIQWLRTKLKTVERAQSYRYADKEREERTKNDIFLRLKGPIYKLADKSYTAAEAYLQELHREPYGTVSRMREVLEMPSTIGGILGQIQRLNSPDLLLFSVERDLVQAMALVSRAISAAGALYAD